MLFERKVILTFTLLTLASLAALSQAQQPQPKTESKPPPQPVATPPEKPDDDVIKTNINLIQLDAVVTDKQGRQVSDLTAADFEIVEGGRVITPEYLSYVSLGPVTSEKPAGLQPSANDLRRVFVFVVSNPIVEFAFSSPGSGGGPTRSGSMTTQSRAQRAADSARSLLTWFVDTQMTDLDLAVIADTDSNLGVLSSFTNNREVLHAAIKAVHENASNGRSKPIRVMAVGGDLTLQPLVKRNLGMIETLENVVKQVEGLPGRKIVTLLARGMLFNPRLPYSDVIRERLRKLIETANRSKISIYTLQLRDLSPSGGNFGNDGLIELAKETGGRSIYNTNDLRVGFEEIVEENRGYYLLAYNPGAEARGRPHRLQIRVKRPGLKVLARSEAFASGPKADAIDSSANALKMPYALTDIKVTLTASLVTESPAQKRFVTWNTDLTKVESQPKADNLRAYSFSLSVRVAGPDGVLFKKADRDVAFEVKDSEVEDLLAKGFLSQFEVEAAKPGYYRIGVAIRDNNSGRVGSATRFFEVKKPRSK
ncbi:MAG: VWA domain-containing protein [Pyrinomonadaceae bacterium]